MKKIIILFLIIISNLFSKNLTGFVFDSETKKPLSGTTIRIKDTQFGAYSNKNGKFEIKGLKKDKSYILIASMIGYKTKEIKIVNFSESVNIYLEEISIQTGEIIVSANKRVQAVQDVPISVSVIQKEDINIRNITKLEDVIRYVPGVEVNQDNVSIRGTSGFSFGIGSRTALLVDGFPLIAGDNGDVEFDAIPLYNIERIEVVKGAGSALYGTSAIGGVINIITSEPKEIPDFKIRAYSGIYTKPRYKNWEYSEHFHTESGVNLNYSQKLGKFGFNIGGNFINDEFYHNYRDEKFYSFNSKLNYEFNDYTIFSIASNFNLTDRADWVYWRSLNHATFPPEQTDTKIRLESNQFSVYTNLKHIFNDNHFMNFKSGILSTEFNNTYEKNNSEYRQSEANNINLELQMNSNFSNSFMLTYGLNYLNNSVNSSTYGNRLQQIFSAYAQGEYSKINNTILTLGGRFDYEDADNSDGNLQISPKFGVNYKLNDYSTLRFSTGAGFRTPSVAERYATVQFQGFEVIPNTDLKPERSYSFETGYNYEGEFYDLPLYIDIAVFDNELFDLIEPGFTSENSATIIFDNLTRARIIGTEINLKTFLFDFLGLETSLTYLNPKNADTDEILKYRSEYIWYSGLSIPLNPFTISMNYRFKSKVKNIDERLSVQIADYDARVPIHITDIFIKYNLESIINQPLSVSLIGKNIFDYYYTEIPGNLAQTRFIGLQLNYSRD